MLASRYRVLHRLGEGGMGEVYAAVDETLKRRVALKAIRAEFRFDAASKARFQREAQILSGLDHPHICRVYNYIEEPDGDWLVLELIEGRSLTHAIEAGLSRAAAIRIAQQIADVLVVTHTAGVIHRDLKPANVMLTGTGDVKVLDFGLAASRASRAALETPFEPLVPPAATGVAEDDATRGGSMLLAGGATLSLSTELPLAHTAAGTLMGTLLYMSPEQARGEPATAASDMYSFGLLLQEMLTGRHPHPAEVRGLELLARVQRGDTSPPAGLPRDLAQLVSRLTAPAPAARLTAVDASERLRAIRDKPRRRLRAAVLAAGLILSVAAGVKYTVDVARERAVAVAARDEADRRRGQAESLIEFMLGDLRRKLEPVGRIEILDAVGDKAMEYFSAVPEHQLTDDELLRRATALHQIGSVRITQGRLADATAPLQQSLSLAGELAARAPDDPGRLFELGQSRFWVGFVHWRRRDLDEALRQFLEYVRLSERLVAIDPANPDWQLELSSANSNIGSVLRERGDLEPALERYAQCVRIERALLEGRPAHASLRRALASSHNHMGVVLRTLGRLDEALSHHRVELALQEELVRADPRNTNWQMYLAVAHNYVGVIRDAQGETDAALEQFERAVAILEPLAAGDPANVGWQRELGRNLFRLGRARLDGRRQGSLRDLDRAVVVLSRAAAADPANVAWQRDLAEALHARGQAWAAAGTLDTAWADGAEALARMDQILTTDPSDAEAARLRASALLLRGEIEARRGRQSAATREWEQALATIEPLARDSRDYRVLDPWTRTLALLGRPAEAGPGIARLQSAGYRTLGLPTDARGIPPRALPGTGR